MAGGVPRLDYGLRLQVEVLDMCEVVTSSLRSGAVCVGGVWSGDALGAQVARLPYRENNLKGFNDFYQVRTPDLNVLCAIFAR